MPDVDSSSPQHPAASSSSASAVAPRHEAEAAARLRQRYSRRPARSFSRRQLTVGAVVVAVLVCAFVIWLVVTEAARPTTKDVGFELISSSRITADFEVTKEPDDVVRCGVEALNENYAVVGYAETTIAEVAPERVVGRTSAHRVEIRTTNQANSAQVVECWVVD